MKNPIKKLIESFHTSAQKDPTALDVFNSINFYAPKKAWVREGIRNFEEILGGSKQIVSLIEDPTIDDFDEVDFFVDYYIQLDDVAFHSSIFLAMFPAIFNPPIDGYPIVKFKKVLVPNKYHSRFHQITEGASSLIPLTRKIYINSKKLTYLFSLFKTGEINDKQFLSGLAVCSIETLRLWARAS